MTNKMKRLFDIICSFAGLAVLAPLTLVVAAIIKLTSQGPVLFSQDRVGMGGRVFRVYKFRTMVDTVHELGSTVTTGDDVRITPVGKFLRRFKLDELPQLINVFVGDMSFVGPRPDVVGFADRLKGEDRIILTVRPGITGPATLKYRDEEKLLARQEDPDKYNEEVIFPDKVRINREYVKNYSFWKDIGYIIETILG
jgi:lipopolysaccharide/colanic/teichoic acid biosynthesis glycosyltransferase